MNTIFTRSRHLLALTLCVLLGSMLSTVLLATTASASTFPDVPRDHPLRAEVTYAAEQGIASGYPDGTFRPDASVNRAEFLKILIRSTLAESESVDLPHQPFAGDEWYTDVPRQSWYGPYVALATARQIVQGYPDGSFGPDRTINYAEAAKIIVRLYDLPLGTDPSTADIWYLPYTTELDARITLPASLVDPQQRLTRAEMVALVARTRQHFTDWQFTQCGLIEDFTDQPWHDALVAHAADRSAQLGDLCLSPDAQRLIFILEYGAIPCGRMQVLHLDQWSDTDRHITTALHSPHSNICIDTIGQRTGDRITVSGTQSDDFCTLTTTGEYFYHLGRVSGATTAQCTTPPPEVVACGPLSGYQSTPWWDDFTSKLTQVISNDTIVGPKPDPASVDVSTLFADPHEDVIDTYQHLVGPLPNQQACHTVGSDLIIVNLTYHGLFYYRPGTQVLQRIAGPEPSSNFRLTPDQTGSVLHAYHGSMGGVASNHLWLTTAQRDVLHLYPFDLTQYPEQ